MNLQRKDELPAESAHSVISLLRNKAFEETNVFNTSIFARACHYLISILEAVPPKSLRTASNLIQARLQIGTRIMFLQPHTALRRQPLSSFL